MRRTWFTTGKNELIKYCIELTAWKICFDKQYFVFNPSIWKYRFCYFSSTKHYVNRNEKCEITLLWKEFISCPNVTALVKAMVSPSVVHELKHLSADLHQLTFNDLSEFNHWFLLLSYSLRKQTETNDLQHFVDLNFSKLF